MYSGNAVVVNLLMRFPVLIPAAIAVGIATVAPLPDPVVVIKPPVVEQPVFIPTPVVKVEPPAPAPAASAPEMRHPPAPVPPVLPPKKKKRG